MSPLTSFRNRLWPKSGPPLPEALKGVPETVNRILTAPDHDQVVKNTEEIEALQEWQKRQNGSLYRIEDRLEKIYWWLVGSLLTTVGLFGSIMILIITQVVFK